MINLEEYAGVGTHWIALFCKRSEIVYFNSFGVEHKEVKSIKANIFRVQANNIIMCGCFCNEFIDFMLSSKTLVDFTSLFSPNDFEKNGGMILSYYKYE